MIHGKNLVRLASEHAGINKQQLIELAQQAFGADVTFKTCKVEGLSLQEMLDFFIENGRIELSDGIKVNPCGHCSNH